MSAPTRLRHRVGAAIREHGLWDDGARVAVAVSGGLDSVVLLDLLHATRRWHGGVLSVVTVEHGAHALSASHAHFVVSLCDGLGLSCTVVRLDLGEGASEERCRTARYAAFEELDVDRVALAHHADDQAETVLLNLLRGTGTRGLAGMRPRRDRWVRPLLHEPRSALESWARSRSLRWVEDPTNAESRFLRNRVRSELLPLLESLRPGAGAAIARSATWFALDDDALERATPEVGAAVDVAQLVAMEPAVALRALGRWAPGTSLASRRALLAIARHGRGRSVLAGGRVAVVKDGQLSWDP